MAKDLVTWKPNIDKTGATTLYQRKSGTYASGKPRKYRKKLFPSNARFICINCIKR